jgi:diaminopimelate epimerase
MRFAKLHGLGNDFLLLDLRAGGEPLDSARALALCDRHRGVGGDGVLTLLPSREGDARMLIQNSDGSVPEMCGNGARCAALWLATEGGQGAGDRQVLLLTDAGPRPCRVRADSPRSGQVTVGMGAPRFEGTRALGARGDALSISMGNPHRVLFGDGDPRALAERYGRELCLAEGANIEFVARLSPRRYRAVVYERGAGLTEACGTGACAVAAAAIARGEAAAGEDIVIELPGGFLSIRQDSITGELWMTGPAELVFEGELG